MIARLTGTLDGTGPDWCVIDVGGVGYLVHCSGRTLARLGAAGGRVVLRIDTQVREDAITLYGFLDRLEQDWFRLLLTVQGVGARVALAVLTALDPDRLGQAIALGDRVSLARADGVGPKLANRLASELKDRAAALGAPPGSPPGSLMTAGPVPESGAVADAVSGLVNLGYRRAEAFAAVAAAARRAGPEAAAGDLIRLGLRELAP